MATERELFDELSFYTLPHPGPAFIHQHAVDAFFAQTANNESKPMGVVFSLVGLYLHVERNFSGRAVQRVHMQLAKSRKQWPKLQIPQDRGSISVKDVLDACEGEERDASIHDWCRCVWESWRSSRIEIIGILQHELGIE